MTTPPVLISADKPSRFGGFWPVVLIALAGAAAYANSFSCPFIFDDYPGIIHNASIRNLGNIGAVLSPPPNASGAGGRPLVNLSLAVNYAISGTQVWSYHAVNLCLHILAALALFGVVRRTLESSRFREKSEVGTGGPPVRSALGTSSDGRAARPYHLALAIALVWTVHPLLTESVVCVIQRNEVLCGLFYLLTLYCFIRGSEVERIAPNTLIRANEVERVVPNALGRGVWYGLSVLCCLLGMASKEVMVSAPIIVLLYDRTFVSGSFRSAWSQRKKYYLALASTWLLLAWLVLSSHDRGDTVGFGLGADTWGYALMQCRAIVIYLKLCIWPHPLVLDYGDGLVRRLSDVILPALGLCALLTATAVGIWKRRAWGFLGAWFFLILAPSSSVLPLVTQTVAEHRMYLPLAAVVTLLVLMLQRLLGKFALPALLLLAAVFGWLTFQRNETYRTEEIIWRDTIAKCPDNQRAYYNLGRVLALTGRMAEAVTEYEAALRLNPDNPESHYNLGLALSIEGRTSEAIAQYETALRLGLDIAAVHFNLAVALLKTPGRTDEAVTHLEAVLRLQPGNDSARQILANIAASKP